jgi:NADH:ubiquinone reductase (H+-translocating)
VSLSPKIPHVVVVGAGYAGLSCALRLARHKNIRVSLVNSEARQELTCDLYRTLRSGRPYTFAFAKQAAQRGLRFIEARVTRIDPELKTLELRGVNPQKLSYDALVLAPGLRNVPPTIDGLAELLLEDKENLSKRIFQFKKTSHVQSLRSALARVGWSPKTRDQRDRFVVVLGAGSTGIEVAGELAYLRGKNKRCRIVLLDEHPSLLRDFSPVARKLFRKDLKHLQIETVLGSPAKRISREEILLENGQVIPWDLMVLCTGSLRAPSWTEDLKNAQYQSGIVVDSNFEIRGHPLHYAIGDLARYTLEEAPLKNPTLLPRRAQFAIQSGHYLAELLPVHLFGASAGKPPPRFSVQDLGYLVTLGPSHGIGRIGPQAQNRLARWVSPFIQGGSVDKLKALVRIRYLLSLKRDGFRLF